MLKNGFIRHSFLYIFITTLILSVLLYGYFYFFSKSTPTGLRIFFTFLVIAVFSIEVYCCLSIYTAYKIFCGASLLLVVISLLVNLAATWNAPFLATYWLFTEVLIALSAIAAGIAILLSFTSKGK